MDEENKVYISQNCTFFIGVNHVMKEKILVWRNESEIDWPSFLWYISQHIKIIDFGDDWLEFNIITKKKLTNFYNRSIMYDAEFCKQEYEKDKTSDLWKKYKPGFTKFSIRENILSVKTYSLNS